MSGRFNLSHLVHYQLETNRAVAQHLMSIWVNLMIIK